MYSLGQAARAAGKAKSTISRDVKRGKISAGRNADGSLTIDPAELHRVYPAVFDSNGAGNVPWNESQPHPRTSGKEFLARENALLRDQLVESREAIRDLRTRLDASEVERRQLSERIHGLLTGWAEKPGASNGRPFSPSEAPPAACHKVLVVGPDAEAPVAAADRDTDAVAAERIAAGETAGSRAALDHVHDRTPWWRGWFR